MGTFGAFPDFGSEPYLVSVGNRVGFAAGVVIITHDGGTLVFNREERYRRVIKYGRVTIHDNSFLGRNVVLMPGAEIGPNTVVGAGAVVTRKMPPDTVIAGSPARVLMSVEAYAEQCLADTPDYDPVAYHRDKRMELVRLFPRPW
jgi:acetyltransferase-like isoleucine patch superfamily enzyme